MCGVYQKTWMFVQFLQAFVSPSQVWFCVICSHPFITQQSSHMDCLLNSFSMRLGHYSIYFDIFCPRTLPRFHFVAVWDGAPKSWGCPAWKEAPITFRITMHYMPSCSRLWLCRLCPTSSPWLQAHATPSDTCWNTVSVVWGLNLSPGLAVLVFSSSVGSWVNGSIVEYLVSWKSAEIMRDPLHLQ